MGPLLFTPFLRPLVWGGRRLGERLGKVLPDDRSYGESWEVSDHREHSSVVATGPLADLSLRELMTSRRDELMGPFANRHHVFPWLVKHLDANDWLSVQVHPNDEQASRLCPGELGKTETWIVLDADPGSRIYAGLRPGVDEPSLKAALAHGTVADCLHSFTPKAGDAVFLPAGTVHAVGGGVLFLEIQQTSDATFRLFDWNRRDAQGKSRPLHIEEALACIDWKRGEVKPLTTTSADRQVLATCEHFHIEMRSPRSAFAVGGDGGPELFVVLSGDGTLETDHGPQKLKPGQAWLLPATMKPQQCLPEVGFTFVRCTLPR